MSSERSRASGSRPPATLEGRTAWGRSVETPLRDFLRTETRERGRPARRHAGRAGLGQHRRGLLRGLLAHHALAPPGRGGARAGPAPLGQQRPDDLLLPRHRPRGAARVRRGRAAQRSRATLPLVAGIGGMVVPVLIYLAFNSGLDSQRGWGTAMSTDTAFALGHARARRRAQAGPSARVPAHGRGHRRHRRADGHRARLQPARGCRRPAGGRRPVRRRARRPRAAHPRRLAVLRARPGDLGRALRVGRRAGRRRAGHGAADLRLSGGALGPGDGDRALPLLPRAADARAGAHRAGRRAVRHLTQRSPAAPLPPLDELRDRAPVRTGQRRHRRERRLPADRLHVAHHARHPGRLRRRQAGRRDRRLGARLGLQPRPPAAAGGLGVGRRQRHHRRHRLHRLPAHRDARLRRPPARGGEAGGARRSAAGGRSRPGSSSG